jgi:tetratricopeptide (TPR) repeat protein
MKKKFVFSVMVFLFIAAGVYGQSAAAKAAYDRGMAANSEGDKDKAIAEYTEAIRLYPNYWMAYANRGGVYSSKRDDDRAIADYTEAIRIVPNEPSIYESRGGNYYSKKDYNRAIADYTEAIRLRPNFAATFYDRGNVYKAMGDYANAKTDYEAALRINPNYILASNELARLPNAPPAPKPAAAPAPAQNNAAAAKAAFDRGMAALVNNEQFDMVKAVDEFTEAIRLNPNYAEAYYQRGIIYGGPWLYENAAIEDFSQAIRINPNYKEAYKERYNMYYFYTNDWDRALADATQLIRIDPKNTWAYYHRGLAYEKKKDNTRARADYEAALRLDPKFTQAKDALAKLPPAPKPAAAPAQNNAVAAEAAYKRGGEAYKQKNWDKAITEYTEAIRLNSNYLGAYSDRGKAYLFKGDLDRSIADFTKAIQLDPYEVFRSSFFRGFAYYNKKNWDLAITDFTQAVKIFSKDYDAYIYRARSYKNKGDNTRAKADYEAAFKIEPNLAEKTVERGRNTHTAAIFGKATFDEAIEEFTEAISLNPNYADAYYHRGQSYRAKENWNNAISDFNQVLRLDPDLKSAFLIDYLYGDRGSAYLKINNWDNAIADLTKDLQLHPGGTQAANKYYNRGLAYLGKKDNDRAIADFLSALKSDPKHANSKRELDRLGVKY